MTAREILLKHVNEGTSERVKKLHEIVDWSIFIAAMEEYAEQQVKNFNKPAVIKSAFKCDDVELQPIECEKWRGCFDCPHYKAVL